MENTSGSVFINQYLAFRIFRSLAFRWFACATTGTPYEVVRAMVGSGQATFLGLRAQG